MKVVLVRFRETFRGVSTGSSEVSKVVSIGLQGSSRRVLGDIGRLQRVLERGVICFQGFMEESGGFRVPRVVSKGTPGSTGRCEDKGTL